MPAYLIIDDLLELIDGPNGEAMRRLIDDHRELCAHAHGSSGNHQAWIGGFWDHTAEVLNIARVQYEALNACRPLPFTLSDALLILCAHDLEKMARYAADGTANPALDSKEQKAAFRRDLLDRYAIALTPEQANALRFAEGVRDTDYRSSSRTMGPLAAFVHTCDLLSARLWFNHPLATSDPWAGAARSHPDSAAVTLDAETFDADGRPRRAAGDSG